MAMPIAVSRAMIRTTAAVRVGSVGCVGGPCFWCHRVASVRPADLPVRSPESRWLLGQFADQSGQAGAGGVGGRAFGHAVDARADGPGLGWIDRRLWTVSWVVDRFTDSLADCATLPPSC